MSCSLLSRVDLYVIASKIIKYYQCGNYYTPKALYTDLVNYNIQAFLTRYPSENEPHAKEKLINEYYTITEGEKTIIWANLNKIDNTNVFVMINDLIYQLYDDSRLSNIIQDLQQAQIELLKQSILNGRDYRDVFKMPYEQLEKIYNDFETLTAN